MKDSIDQIVKFFESNTAVSQTIALETAAAVQVLFNICAFRISVKWQSLTCILTKIPGLSYIKYKGLEAVRLC